MKRNIMFVLGGAALLLFAISAVRVHGPLTVLGIRALAAASSSQNELAPVADPALSNDPEVARAESQRSVDGQLTAEYHRTRVSTLVDSLLLIADREDPENGLSERLRIVAHSLRDSGEPTTEAIEKIAYRSPFSLFGGGSDLSAVRDAAETEKSALDTLDGIQKDMTDAVDNAALETACGELTKDIAVLAAFTATHGNQ